MMTASVSAPKQVDRDELASAKLWAVYISEAEKYDKALVEGWKSDMEGLLIFAGIFSASLTAFLIESYKTLSPDQSAITIALLAQISLQLDPSSNAKSAVIPSSSFTPTTTSLACNTLWFLSLVLSLSCALIAILVEQWTRDFIQRTEMRHSSVIRARIFSYLCFGMQRFGMHTFVEFIPLLLHASLLLFFAGLVAFLLPINQSLMIVVAALLGFISVIYIYLTMLPILWSDAPYRTSLSNVTWRFLQRLLAISRWRQRFFSDTESGMVDYESRHSGTSIPTMIEVMNRDAIVHSSKRDNRDGRAIIWTMNSVTDNNELESFIEALPDLIGGPNSRRGPYDHMVNMLLKDRGIRLVQRIESLLRSCDDGLLHPEHEIRRRLTCIKALWVISYFFASDATQENFPVFSNLKRILSSQLIHPHPRVKSYSSSTFALVRWIDFSSLSRLVGKSLSMLETSPAVEDPKLILAAIRREADARGYAELDSALSRTIALNSSNASQLMQQFRNALGSLEDGAYDSLVDYMQRSANLDEMPHEFEATCQMIQPPVTQIGPVVQTKLQKALITTLEALEEELSDLDAELHQVDFIMDVVLSVLQEGREALDLEIGRPVVIYIAARNDPRAAFSKALRRCNPDHLGLLLTKYLASGPGSLTSQTLYSIWRLCMFFPELATFDEETLAVVSASRQFPILPSVIAVLKSRIISVAMDHSPDEAHSLMCRLQILPSVSLADRWQSCTFLILIEFLEQLDVSSLKSARATSTFKFLAKRCPAEHYPLSFQQRFSTWFVDITTLDMPLGLVEAIALWLFEDSAGHFDDIGVRHEIAGPLKNYVNILTQDDDSWTRERINITIAQLKSSPDANTHTESILPVDTTTAELSSGSTSSSEDA